MFKNKKNVRNFPVLWSGSETAPGSFASKAILKNEKWLNATQKHMPNRREWPYCER